MILDVYIAYIKVIAIQTFLENADVRFTHWQPLFKKEGVVPRTFNVNLDEQLLLKLCTEYANLLS